MPLLIGDIGGTRSSWALLSSAEGHPHTVELPGFNPVTGDPSALQTALRKADLDVEAKNGPLTIFAYGAGCGTKPRAERLRVALADVWPHAHIQVGTDLLGAARGLYGNEAGLVLILGTGMNVGHYDGSFLHLPMPSLGYILGDEGSGADIGKHLLRVSAAPTIRLAVTVGSPIVPPAARSEAAAFARTLQSAVQTLVAQSRVRVDARSSAAPVDARSSAAPADVHRHVSKT